MNYTFCNKRKHQTDNKLPVFLAPELEVVLASSQHPGAIKVKMENLVVGWLREGVKKIMFPKAKIIANGKPNQEVLLVFLHSLSLCNKKRAVPWWLGSTRVHCR